MLQEQIGKNPAAAAREVYEFLGLDPNFVSSFLNKRANVAQRPRVVFISRLLKGALQPCALSA